MKFTFANVAATLALAVAVGGPAVAGAQSLITGNDVKDESLTGADIQNHSLSGADIRAGSLGSRLFSARALANLRGATGAPGSQGATGPQGATGAGVTTDVVTADAVANYQDLTPLATTTLKRAGDYVMFVDVTAQNTGVVDDNLNCGLFADGQEFGGGGVSVVAGSSGSFTTVGATNVGSGQETTVVLKCQGSGVTTFDVSNIQLRIHDLG